MMVNMLCEKCSTELPADAVACYRCGTMTGNTYVMAHPQPQGRDITSMFTAAGVAACAIVVVLLLAAGAIYFALRKDDKTAATRVDSPPIQSMPPAANTQSRDRQETPPPRQALPEPAKQTEKIVNESQEITAGNMWAIPFTMPNDGSVKGGFTVGGGGKDIKAYIVDDANYPLLASGQAFHSLASFNRVARGRINAALSPGSYYLVFSNKHALWYSKQIAVEMDATY